MVTCRSHSFTDISLKKQGKYRFNEFEVDLALRSLRRDGHAVAVSPRTFDVLTYFVLHPQRLVTQAELVSELWPNASVEESNLSQHIFLLRRALTGAQSGDKLVLTFPGRGFQFTAAVTQIFDAAPQVPPADVVSNFRLDQSLASDPYSDPIQNRLSVRSPRPPSRVSVEILETEGDGEPGALPDRHPALESDSEPEEENPRRSVQSPILIGALVAVLALVCVGGWLGWRWVHRPRPDSLGLVIADFYNSTGNPLFDESIRRAISLDLQQSPFLRVSREQDVRETLSSLKASEHGPSATSLTREVCHRLGNQAYLTGEIHPFAKKLMVAIQAFNCSDGKSLAVSRGVADSPDAVLPILDKVAVDLRRQLGEPSDVVAHFSKPLFGGRAASLDAFKAYADATEIQLDGKPADALPLLQRAVELDPQFTNAYADLGILEASLGDQEMASASLTKAYNTRNTVGEYRRLFIIAAYNDLVTGDLEASIRNEKEGMALYPHNAVFPSNLASFEIQIGKPAMALDPAQRSLALNPGNAALYVDLARAQMQLGQFEEAAATCQKAIARHLDTMETHGLLLQIGYLRLDQAAMDEQLAWAHDMQDPAAEAYMQLQQALIAFAEGKAKAALTIFTSLIEDDRKQGKTLLATRIQSQVPRMEAELGLVEAAHALLSRLPEDAAVDSVDVPVAWAEVGETSRAQALLKRSLEAHTTATLWQQDKGPQIQAAIDLNQQKPQAAIEALQAAMPFEMRSFDGIALRGRAYLAVKQPALAEAEFRKILEHHGVSPVSYNYALAYLGLARALAQQAKTTDARAAYNVLFSIWSGADSDLPRLRAAKEEYARLGGAPARARPINAASTHVGGKPSAIKH